MVVLVDIVAKCVLEIDTSDLRLLFFLPVGYILGLGDRHVQNILINEQSAELVHIDLGKWRKMRNASLFCLTNTVS